MTGAGRDAGGPAAEGEAALIQRFAVSCAGQRHDVVRGIGDDAAVLTPPPGQRLVACCDTLIADVHFPSDASPDAVGHRALAVNLSDLAAMGATPAWALLSLTRPDADAAWVDGAARGFADLASRYKVALVGGDTTRGVCSLTVTALGLLPAGSAGLGRDGARPGDGVYVTGTLGDAALGLRIWQADGAAPLAPDVRAYLEARLLQPEPRVALGQALLGQASAAIDVSDGLAVDLSRVLGASGVGATLDLTALPASDAFTRAGGQLEDALYGGDDYELCFTLPDGVPLEGVDGCVPVTRIGTIDAQPGLRGRDAAGHVASLSAGGYDHFGQAKR